MMKSENYLRTLHTKEKGWFWFNCSHPSCIHYC